MVRPTVMIDVRTLRKFQRTTAQAGNNSQCVIARAYTLAHRQASEPAGYRAKFLYARGADGCERSVLSGTGVGQGPVAAPLPSHPLLVEPDTWEPAGRGKVEGGMARLDASVAAATSGDVADPCGWGRFAVGSSRPAARTGT